MHFYDSSYINIKPVLSISKNDIQEQSIQNIIKGLALNFLFSLLKEIFQDAQEKSISGRNMNTFTKTFILCTV